MKLKSTKNIGKGILLVQKNLQKIGKFGKRFNSHILLLFFRYGNIYSLMLGGEHLIFLSDYDTIKEAFNKDSMNFRPTGSEDFRRAYADFKGIQ